MISSAGFNAERRQARAYYPIDQKVKSKYSFKVKIQKDSPISHDKKKKTYRNRRGVCAAASSKHTADQKESIAKTQFGSPACHFRRQLAPNGAAS